MFFPLPGKVPRRIVMKKIPKNRRFQGAQIAVEIILICWTLGALHRKKHFRNRHLEEFDRIRAILMHSTIAKHSGRPREVMTSSVLTSPWRRHEPAWVPCCRQGFTSNTPACHRHRIAWLAAAANAIFTNNFCAMGNFHLLWNFQNSLFRKVDLERNFFISRPV
jgi:hypothetical protein